MKILQASICEVNSHSSIFKLGCVSEQISDLARHQYECVHYKAKYLLHISGSTGFTRQAFAYKMVSNNHRDEQSVVIEKQLIKKDVATMAIILHCGMLLQFCSYDPAYIKSGSGNFTLKLINMRGQFQMGFLTGGKTLDYNQHV